MSSRKSIHSLKVDNEDSQSGLTRSTGSGTHRNTEGKLSNFLKYLNNLEQQQSPSNVSGVNKRRMEDDSRSNMSSSSRIQVRQSPRRATDDEERSLVIAPRVPSVIHAYDSPPSPTSSISASSSISNQLRTMSNVKNNRTVNQKRSETSPNDDEFTNSVFASSTSLGGDGGNTSGVTVYENIKMRMNKYKAQIREKNQEIHSLRNKLESYIQNERDLTKRIKEEGKETLVNQQKQFESTMNRQIKMIEKLLKEKEQMNAKCTELAKEVKTMDDKYTKKISAIEEKHQQELKRQKETWAAAEKLKRQNWMKEKKQEIKDNTVKDLEPEIQRLLINHKQEKVKLEDYYQDLLRKQRQESLLQLEKEIQNLKEKLVKDTEIAVERARGDERLEVRELKQRSERDREELKNRFDREIKLERDRTEKLLMEERVLYQENLQKMKQNEQELIRRHKEDLDQQIELLNRKHKEQNENGKIKWELEKEQWQNHYMKKMEEEYKQKQKIHVEKVSRQLDEQVEMIVAKMQGDFFESKKKMQDENEKQLSQLKAAHSAELNELQSSISHWKEKYMAISKSNNALELDTKEKDLVIDRLNTEILEKQENVKLLKNRIKEDQEKYDKAISKLMSEHRAELETLCEEKQALSGHELEMQAQIEELRKEHASEIERIEQRSEEELEQVMEASKNALEKKDQKIQELTERLAITQDILKQQQLDANKLENLLIDET